jgi:L-lactate dehydrogenase complex protein LldG
MTAPTTARDEILHRVRAALRPDPAPVTVPRDYLRSARVDDLVGLFTDRLRDYGATVMTTSSDGVADAIGDQVRGRVRVAPGLPWSVGRAGFDVEPDDVSDPAELDQVETAVTACAAACAQTGTIVLDGSPDQGRRALTLIPDRHVCIVHSGQITGTVPELIARLDPTAPLTFISGPSATSDIELTRVAGVHGPRQLVVILVDEEASADRQRSSNRPREG